MDILTADFQQDFFRLFEIPPQFKIDSTLLERRFRALQAQVHPDRFAHLPDAQRRLSMQWATRVNEGYQTLRSPVNRARYLLALRGVDTQEERNTAMPVDFLAQQMEWRETLEDARRQKDHAALEVLENVMQRAGQVLQQQLGAALDEVRDDVAASGIVRKLRFHEKLAEEISDAFDELDS